MLAATVVILGPLASYFVLVVFVGRFRFSQRPDPEPQRMAWTRSRDEIRRVVVGILDELGIDDPVASSSRTRLASALY